MIETTGLPTSVYLATNTVVRRTEEVNVAMNDIHKAISSLQDQLSEAKELGDTEAEIDALLRIGELSLDDDNASGAHMHFRLAEKVMTATGSTGRLHEALGGQGRALRRSKRVPDAVERFLDAERAAKAAKHKIDVARWKLARASALRAMGNIDAAKAAIRETEDILRPRKEGMFSFLGGINLLDINAVSTLAELEGQIGLTAMAERDPDAAEEAYRNAVDLAKTAKDATAINVWATNLGNAYSRRRRYAEAIRCYDLAIDAARESKVPRNLTNIAFQLAVCMAQAHRHEEGAERLVAIADQTADEQAQLAILNQALTLYEQSLSFPQIVAVGQRVKDLAVSFVTATNYLEQLDTRVARADEFLNNPPQLNTAGPTALDIHLPATMAEATKRHDPEAVAQAAHLVCDVRLGLFATGGDQWKRLVGGDLLSEVGLDVKALTDAIVLLIDENQPDAALELLQRYKAPGFCLPTIRRYEHVGAPCAEADDYVQAVNDLSESVAALSGPAQPDFLRHVYKVRRAGEALLESGEILRERDPILNACMGGIVRKDELIDSLPHADPVAIVDYVVGRDCTVGLILLRAGNTVQATPFKNEVFTLEHVRELLEIYGAANLSKAFGGRQTEALAKIGKILHDRLFCKLVQDLSKRYVTQLILIPDPFTRFVPLHMSRICGKEIKTPTVDTEGARYLCEVMPVEYVPCLQAVVASQIYKRPKQVSLITAFADPIGDLPRVRRTLESLPDRLDKIVTYELYADNQARTDKLNACLGKSDVILFGTHGVFRPSEPEASHLVLYDRPWTMADMIDQPELVKNPVMVLAACEIGAIAPTPDERDAYGIPGALLSTGAATVVANLWPVEDVSMGYLLERFLEYLSYPGYSPAAALFRVVRKMRRLSRQEVLDLYRQHIEDLKRHGAEDRVILSAENLLEWIEDSELEYPFSDPLFWGATIVVGSGWHLPAGGIVGGGLLRGPELYMKQMKTNELINAGDYRAAMRAARELAAESDGVFRANALTTLAWSTYMAADIVGEEHAKRVAHSLLQQAARTARAEDDSELLSRINEVKKLMEV